MTEVVIENFVKNGIPELPDRFVYRFALDKENPYERAGLAMTIDADPKQVERDIDTFVDALIHSYPSGRVEYVLTADVQGSYISATCQYEAE